MTHPLEEVLSTVAIKAAINYVEMCNEHTAIILVDEKAQWNHLNVCYCFDFGIHTCIIITFTLKSDPLLYYDMATASSYRPSAT